jgi:lipoprotein-anchoring transpeptidase ErfK/SrfK
LLLLVCLLVGTAVIGGVSLFVASPLLLPGTQVMGVDVGGLSVNETAVILNDTWAQGGLTLENGTVIWTLSPAELGLTLNAQATAEQAHAYGRTPAGLLEWVTTGKLVMTPVYELDTAVAAATLQTLAPHMASAPQNATVRIANGWAEATPALPGQALDVAATIAYLQTYQAAVLAHGRLPLSTTLTPAAITDISGIINELNQLLNRPVVVSAYDPITDETLTWEAAPDVWGNWVSAEMDPAQPGQLTWHLDSEAGRAFWAAQADKLGDGRTLSIETILRDVTQAIQSGETAVTVRILHPPTQYTVQAGDTLASIGRDLGLPYPWIQRANPGIESLNPGQTITIPSLDVMLPMPVVPHKRIIVSISQQTVQVFENGALKWDWPASTGITSSPTAPGIFQVQTHSDNAYAANWDLWMPNFMGIYRPVPGSDFMNGFHGFPTRDGYNLLWTNNLGGPVTYGCILISNENAQALYEWAEDGVVVEIQP